MWRNAWLKFACTIVRLVFIRWYIIYLHLVFDKPLKNVYEYSLNLIIINKLKGIFDIHLTFIIASSLVLCYITKGLKQNNLNQFVGGPEKSLYSVSQQFRSPWTKALLWVCYSAANGKFGLHGPMMMGHLNKTNVTLLCMDKKSKHFHEQFHLAAE